MGGKDHIREALSDLGIDFAQSEHNNGTESTYDFTGNHSAHLLPCALCWGQQNVEIIARLRGFGSLVVSH